MCAHAWESVAQTGKHFSWTNLTLSLTTEVKTAYVPLSGTVKVSTPYDSHGIS